MNSLKGPLIALVLVVLAYYAWVGLTRRTEDKPTQAQATTNQPAPQAPAPPADTPTPNENTPADTGPAYPTMEILSPIAKRDDGVTPTPYMPSDGGVGNVQITDLEGPSGGDVGMSSAFDTMPAGDTIETVLMDVNDMIARQEFVAALRLLSPHYDRPELTPVQRQQVLELLNGLAYSVIYSPHRHLLHGGPHIVTAEERTLADIAPKYKVPAALLASINGKSENESLYPGQPVKVVNGPFDAVVDLGDGVITMMLGGQFAGQFPLQTTADSPVPEGDYLVEIKHVDPQTKDGGHWIGLQTGEAFGHLAQPPIAMHGDQHYMEIGHGETWKPIPMGEQQIRDVFNILSAESRVSVRR